MRLEKNCKTGDRRYETGDVRQETRDRIYETGDVRHETEDRRYETKSRCVGTVG